MVMKNLANGKLVLVCKKVIEKNSFSEIIELLISPTLSFAAKSL